MLITPRMTLETKKALPKTLLRPTWLELELEAVNEMIPMNTSPAPFPSGRRVTPAKVGERFKTLDKLSKELQKYFALVFPNR